MRKPERLYGFYNELTRVHVEHFSDWRFGQFISNFFDWIVMFKGNKDPFFIEESDMLDLLHEYVGEK
jgi:hypothetical protein